MKNSNKIIMISSSLFLGILGIVFIFLSEEFLKMLGNNHQQPIMYQILGSLFFGFAMLNWISKDSMIGGIYLKPISIANFTNFFIGGISLLKYSFENNNSALWIITIIYITFAFLFGKLFYLNPKKNIS